MLIRPFVTAAGDITKLSADRSPGTFTMKGSAYLGGAPGGYASYNSYAGSFAGVQIVASQLNAADAKCLYGLASQHAGVCPGFHISGAEGRTFREANDVAFAGIIPGLDDVTVSEDGDRLVQDSGFDARDMNGPSTFMMDTSNSVKDCAKICVDQSYQYIGLQWSNQCFCSNVRTPLHSVPNTQVSYT